MRHGLMMCAVGMFVLGLGATAWAAGPAGEWIIEVDFAGQPVEASLTITENADGTLKGTIVSDQGTLEINNVQYQDGKVSFKASLDTGGGQMMEFTFEGQLADDVLTGKIASDLGEMSVRGTRGGIVGTWEVTSESQLGTRKRTLIVKEDLSATLKGESDEYAVSDLKVENGKVTFKWTLKEQGNDIPLEFEGTITGRNLKGVYKMDGQEAAQVAGVKQLPVASDPALMAGTWSLEIDSPIGKLEHKLTVNADGTTEYDQGTEKGPVSNLVVGKEVSWDVNIQGYDVKFKGTLDGDSLTGSYHLDGEPVAPTTGKRGDAQTAAPAAGGGITAEVVMQMMDQNKDGKISLDEAPEMLKQNFAMVDANADGGIDLKEAELIANFMNANRPQAPAAQPAQPQQ